MKWKRLSSRKISNLKCLNLKFLPLTWLVPIISFPIYHLSRAKRKNISPSNFSSSKIRYDHHNVIPLLCHLLFLVAKSAIIYVIHCLSFHIAWKLICINFEYAKIRWNKKRKGKKRKSLSERQAHGIDEEDIMKSRVKKFFFSRSPYSYL